MDWPRSGRAWGQQITSGLEPGTPSLLLQANLGLLPYYFIINKNTESPSSDRRSPPSASHAHGRAASTPAPCLMVLPDSWGHHASPAVGASQDAGPQAGLVPLLLAGALLAGPGPRQGKPNCTVYRADRSIHLLLYLFRRINRKMTIHLLTFISGEGDAQTPAGF